MALWWLRPYNQKNQMNPKIIAVQGPLEGENFPLAGETLIIGREPSSSLCLQDRRVSRRHSQIDRRGERFRISDLESSNGTYVNGFPVKEHFLEHGDQIAVGSSLFLFLVQDEESIPSNQVELADGPGNLESSIGLQQEDTIYLKSGDTNRWSLPAERMARDLQALLRISTTLNSVQGLTPLLQQLLELMFEVIPAQRGAILLGDGPGNYSSQISWERASGPVSPIRVSRTIAAHTGERGTALLCNEVPSDKMLSDSDSLVASGVQSVLCVPLQLLDRPMGVIYLETSNPANPFDESHLHFLTATASAASVAIENTRRLEWLENENNRLRQDIDIQHSMIGESEAMQKVYSFIGKVAARDSTVLLTGENGTGKELAARAIHGNSPRSKKPFLAINCASLQEHLLESDLFGHEKGAFTGAIKEKKGKLEIANGGTVLLDEVGELAPNLQAKLLRVVQEREMERVGGNRPIKVDIRLIAATNRDLEKAIKEGTFRQDLFYRLNVISLPMPALRERPSDIPLLAQHFASKYSQKCKRPVVGLSSQVRTILVNYDWPGNVRELENAIERAVVLGTSDVILPEDLPEALLDSPLASSVSDTYHDALRQRKEELILQAVRRTQGNYTEAAKLLDLHPNYLHRLVRNMGLKEKLKT